MFNCIGNYKDIGKMHGMQLPTELMTSTWQGSAIIHQHHDASFFTSSVGLSCFLYLPVAQVAALSWVLEASEYQAALRVGVPKLPVRLGIGGVSVDLTRSIRKELPQIQAPGLSCCILGMMSGKTWRERKSMRLKRRMKNLPLRTV
jgi:hypothetical protein